MKKNKKETVEENNEKKLQSTRQNIADVIFSRKLLWGAIFVVLLTLLSSPFRYLFIPVYEIDAIARTDVTAAFDLEVRDEVTTAAKRREVIENFPSVYNYNANVREDVIRELRQFFRQGREGMDLIERSERDEHADSVRLLEKEGFSVPVDKVEYLSRKLDLKPDAETLSVYIDHRFNENLEGTMTSALGKLLRRLLVDNRDYFILSNRNGVIKRDFIKNEEDVMHDFSTILGLEEARLILENEFSQKELWKTVHQDREMNLVKKFAENFVSANFLLDEMETNQRLQQAVENVDPIFYRVKKGKKIVRKGDVITEKIQAELKAQRQGMEQSGKYFSTTLGFLIINTFLIFFTWRYTRYYQHHTRVFKNLFVMLGSIYVGMVLLIKALMILCVLLGESFDTEPFSDPNSWFLAIPFAAGAMVVILLVDAQMAIICSIVMSVMAGILGGGDFSLALYALAGNITATYAIHQYKDRTALIKSALMVGFINILTILALNLATSRLITVSGIAFEVVCGFFGGFLVSVVSFISLPLLESAFNVLTDIRLLELSNQNIPLLQKLAVQAPGTYHHSIVVGTLAESAADVIRANPLFCRVSAYYHDIGKIKKPVYFVENQAGTDNKHENLSPHMSSLIIISHVKDGVEIAKTHNLPKSLTDIIPQHHGTRLINYFYHKARELKNPKAQEVKEEDFRYPGPKPKTKEAAIMMLADAVEAASRTLSNPTPARLKGMVKKIFNDIFLDGQLDQCDLTLKDLDKISSCFLRILTGIYHQRIDYPNFPLDGDAKGPGRNGHRGEKLSEKILPEQK